VGKRSRWARRSSTGASTFAKRAAVAHETAERVQRWRREDSLHRPAKRVRHGRSRGVLYRVVVAPGERLYDRKTKRWHDNESRVEDLLEDAKRSGLVDQWDGSRGFFWWEGKPGAAMRALRNAIGGESVRKDERLEDAARRTGNDFIAGRPAS
jgi:hypothetical protein